MRVGISRLASIIRASRAFRFYQVAGWLFFGKSGVSASYVSARVNRSRLSPAASASFVTASEAQKSESIGLVDFICI